MDIIDNNSTNYNFISEFDLTNEIQSEYFRLLRYYENFKRQSIFVKYYNINIANSTYDKDTKATLNLYNNSSTVYDLYELTPVFYIGPLTNAIALSDTRTIPTASTTIVTYTIQYPREHDLVVFYKPYDGAEIFKVTGVKTPVNALHATPGVWYYELDLEYAPLSKESLNNIQINNKYAYDMSNERYMDSSLYVKYISILNKIKSNLEYCRQYYEINKDMYIVDGYALSWLNEIIAYIKTKFESKNRRILEHYKKPYGYIEYCPIINWEYFDLLMNDATVKFKYLDRCCLKEKFFDNNMSSISDLINDSKTDIDKLLPILRDLYRSVLELDNFYKKIGENGDCCV